MFSFVVTCKGRINIVRATSCVYTGDRNYESDFREETKYILSWIQKYMIGMQAHTLYSRVYFDGSI